MPYPIAKLPYGLRRRLGELATPSERYDLQIAAGNAAICPPKLQPIKKVFKHLKFRWRNGAISVVTKRFKNTFEITSFVFNEDSLTYASKTCVSLIGFDFQSISSDMFGNFLLRPSWLQLYNCVISKPLLDRLSKLTSGSLKMLSIDNTDCSDNLSGGFLDKLNAFPLLNFLEICKVFLTQSWISDILKSRPQKLMHIIVRVLHDQFHAFEYDELITLLRTQPQGFYMSIDVHWSACECLDKFFDGLKSHLDQQLIICDKHNDDFDPFDDDDDDDYYDNDDDVDDNNDHKNLDEPTKFEMHHKGKTCCWYLPTDQADVSSKKRTISSESSDDSVLPVCKKQKTTNDCT